MRWSMKLLWLTVILFFLGAVIWFGQDRSIPHQAFEKYSVHSAAPEGLSLAYKYLRSEPSVGVLSTLSRPLERAFLESNAVLFRIRPNSSVPPGLQRPDPRTVG